MHIENSNLKDLTSILELYRIATDYMKSKKQVHWPEFSEELIVQEINEKRQWKLVIDDQIACIWVTTLQDEIIWGDDQSPSLYLHRAATHPNFRGQKLIQKLFQWANDQGKKMGLEYLRMDTVGLNHGLINLYKKMGFDFLGTKQLENTDGLPDHYKVDEVCYFQKKIK